MHTATAERNTDTERRPLHRVGSLLVTDLHNPQTIGQRIAARRLELGMKQEEVAAKCLITQKSDSRPPKTPTPGWKPRLAGTKTPLSRTAYSMYESDSVAPVMDVLVQIAAALQTTPAYIAFGDGVANPVSLVMHNPKTDEFEHLEYWNLKPGWLRELTNVEPHDLALIRVPDYSPNLKPGDIAIVRKGVEPPHNGEFVYSLKGEVGAGHVSRPERGGPYRVYAAGKRSGDYQTVDPADLVILGAVVGKLGAP